MSQGQVTLLSLSVCRGPDGSFHGGAQGGVSTYILQLAWCSKCWVVTRRYSEFLRCNVQLLETFGRADLPQLPPKEPLLQKMFGKGAARAEWSTTRSLGLQRYVVGLLERPRVVERPVFLEFIEAPWRQGAALSLALLRASSSPTGDLVVDDVEVAISGVRVRLTGEPGVVEVAVRAAPTLSSSSSASPEAVTGGRAVKVELLRLADDGAEDGESTQKALGGATDRCSAFGVSRAQYSATIDCLPAGEEAFVRFNLEPGSVWQATAAYIGDGSGVGAVRVQLRAPTAQEHVGLQRRTAPASLLPEYPLVDSIVVDVPPAVSVVEASIVEVPPVDSVVESSVVEDAAQQPQRETLLTEALLAAPVPAAPEAAEAESFAAAAPSASSWPSRPTSTSATPATTPVASQVVTPATALAAAGERAVVVPTLALPVAARLEAASLDAPPLQLTPLAAATPVADPVDATHAEGLAPVGASPRMRLPSLPEAAPLDELDVREGVANGAADDGEALQVQQSSRAAARAAGGGFSNNAGEAHSARGMSAADYVAMKAGLREVHEVRGRASSDRGGFMPSEAPGVIRRDVQELDSSRNEQRQLEILEDELAAARWIYAVTGDDGAKAAAEGTITLEIALQSGEVLCDLVNAVWPGHVVGILRGQVKAYRRVENVTLFLKACEDLGMGLYDLFAPVDLTEGKNPRSVVRCVFALDSLVTKAPMYDGPRLVESLRSRVPRRGT